MLASFAAPAAWTPDAHELVQSGLELLTFTFDVELRRPVVVWLDSTLVRVRMVSSVKFDTLTGVYQVSKQPGRPPGRVDAERGARGRGRG